MQTKLIRIGNSQGVRLPKSIIEQIGIVDQLEMEVSDGCVIIRPASSPRDDWAEAAAACHQVGEDTLDDWDATIGDFEGEWE